MAKLRTFIAVELSDKVRARALDLIERLRPSMAKVKWVGAGELHWTLKFLGDVDTGALPRICDAMVRAVAPLAPFELEAVGAGAFPVAERPRTVWLGIGTGEEAFVALHAALEGRLARLGFREEQRRFRPHITIGRVRRSPQGIGELGRSILDQAAFSAGRMTVGEVVLFSSRLERQGPVYDILGRAGLEGRPVV